MTRLVTTFFRDLAVEASVGFHAAEKAARQRILIDFEYDSNEPAEVRDDVATVLDYDAVRQAVAAIAKRGHFNLQETLCRAILQHLIERPEIVRARVSVRKPDIYPDVDSVGVRMEASKP